MPSNDVLAFPQPSALLVPNGTDTFSWPNEFRHFTSSNFLSILWWPVFKMQQRYISASPLLKECKKLPGFKNLWKTIQKGSFAYNVLLLNLTPAMHDARKTDLADITTLALFFGDEFLDGICRTAGKLFIKKMFSSSNINFYMQVNQKENSVELEYAFDLKEKLPVEVMESVNEKYLISYFRFYDLLQIFLVYINQHLNQLERELAKKSAQKIAEVCNNCFDSYLNDVINSPLQDIYSDVSEIANIHELKTRKMQRQLLELRCVLAQKEKTTKEKDIEGWLNIMSVVQVYDDLQDVVEDDGVQDNVVLFMAKKHFPEESKWFLKNKDILIKNKKQHSLLISLNMPCSAQACLHVAAEKIKAMDWEQQKIMHYLLAKNWFSRSSNLHDELTNDPASIYKLLGTKMNCISDHLVKSYAIDTCFHDRHASRKILRKINCKTAYQLRYNLLTMPAQTKAQIIDLILE